MTRDDRTHAIKQLGKLARRRATLEERIADLEDQIREIDREAAELTAALFPQPADQAAAA